MSHSIHVAILIILSFSISLHARKQILEEDDSIEKVQIIQNICQGKESVTSVHFYVQDLLAGHNKTVFDVAKASITENSKTSFGQVRVLDDLLTAEPDINSEVVGRAQGMIISSDLETSALTMNLNFYFTSGTNKGSTITIAGRNELDKESRELPVVGGTGKFRFARGYAITRTHSYDFETSYGILEYTIYVTYMDDASPSLAVSM